MFCTLISGTAQVNPLGIYIDTDGKAKFWESEANLNGNLDDTVFVTCGAKTHLEDLRNLKLINLTFLEKSEKAL